MRKLPILWKPVRNPLSLALQRALQQPARMAGGILAIGLVGGGLAAQAQTLQLSALNGSNGFVINGISGSDNSGRAVSGLGDVNGDGIDDLLVGAPTATVDGDANTGASYVVFGSTQGFNSALELSTLDGDNGFIINGVDGGDRSGIAVSGLGDVNGDDIDDLLIGAYFADPHGSDSGEAYVVFGTTRGFDSPFELSALDGNDGFVIHGIIDVDRAGAAVAGSGDVNGDGIADLLIGADGANPNGPSSGAGYVLFGRSDGFNNPFELSSLNGSNGFTINGVDEFNNAAKALSAGDFNGDGIDDVLIGAPKADANGNVYSGESYVVFGSTQPFGSEVELSALDGSDGFIIRGIDAGDYAGRAVSGLSDVNGDGIDDMLIGAYKADPGDNNNADDNTGESYVVFGHTGSFNSTFELSALNGSNGFIINGIDPGDVSGKAVSGLGDVNGDGIDDLLIGAYLGDANNSANSGEGYVVFGRSQGFISPFELSALDGSNGFIINGAGFGDNAGSSVSNLGDFNGDGVDDLLIGAPLADPNGGSSGASYVVFSPDTSPEQFSFTDRTGVARSTLQTSNPITVSGIGSPAPVSVSGGSYSINGGTFTSSPATVSSAATITVRHTSSANFATAVNTVLTIGGVRDTFTSTTVGADTTPAAFSFTGRTNVSPATVVTSNAIAVTGINTPAPISVSGGSYSINGGAFTSAPGTVQNGDTVRVRHTTSAALNTTTNTTLTIGGVSAVFTSVTFASNTLFSNQFEN